MAIPKKLFIPGKNMRAWGQPDYGTDMRAIENYVNNNVVNKIVAGTNVTISPTDGEGTVTINASGGGGTHYSSLVGPGQAVTPGALTQSGDLTILTSTSVGLTVNGPTNLNGQVLTATSTGNVQITQSGTGLLKILNNNSSGSAGITIQSTNAGINLLGPANNIELFTNGGIQIQSGGTSDSISIVGGTIDIGGGAGGKIGFFTSTPVVKPTVTGSRGGNAALASLLTALSSLGLITDSSTP